MLTEHSFWLNRFISSLESIQLIVWINSRFLGVIFCPLKASKCHFQNTYIFLSKHLNVFLIFYCRKNSKNRWIVIFSFNYFWRIIFWTCLIVLCIASFSRSSAWAVCSYAKRHVGECSEEEHWCRSRYGPERWGHLWCYEVGQGYQSHRALQRGYPWRKDGQDELSTSNRWYSWIGLRNHDVR